MEGLGFLIAVQPSLLYISLHVVLFYAVSIPQMLQLIALEVC